MMDAFAFPLTQRLVAISRELHGKGTDRRSTAAPRRHIRAPDPAGRRLHDRSRRRVWRPGLR
jgi:hypothetical protein